MPISWNPSAQQFHLASESTSYVMRVLDNGWLGHLHFGGPIADDASYRHLGPDEFLGFGNRVGEPIALEFPTTGSGDFRVPALVVEQADGSTVLDLRYRSHRINPGKPVIEGLPSTYVEVGGEAETLEVTLEDAMSGLAVELRYTLYRNRPVIIRSARLINGGRSPLILRTAMSASLDLPDSDWTLVTLNGDWARERHLDRGPLRPGRQSIDSTRGTSSSQHNPFVAFARPWATEDAGEVIGASLVYSGNFLAEVEVEPFGSARFRIGINPESFSWILEPQAAFETPEVVLAYSNHGLDDMSQAYHDLYRTRLARGTWRDRQRPVLINNWEATYYDFDEPRLLEIAASARDLGVELFVLDDGWFGRRDDDTTSLGDWQVDRRKLPGGLESLGTKIEAMGLRFGIWIEPEMISRASKLYEAHADWAIGIPSRPRTESRNQYVLDMARPEVVDYLFKVLSDVLGSAPISYVKWDMNRNITEPFSATLPAWRQGEFMHRYIMGVYSLYARLTAAFPGILFESCASGGARFDPGLMAFAPQAWVSDNTDAVDRLRIQFGTSIVYPLSSMGAHVSAVPNHQTGRLTPFATRALVAFFGAFGYELDPTKLSEQERAQIIAQVDFYKKWRELFQFGRLHRLRSPFEADGNETAWMVVAPDKRAAIVGFYRVLSRVNVGRERLRLRGLDPRARYRLSTWPVRPGGSQTDLEVGGDALMAAGIVIEGMRESVSTGDFHARLYVIEAAQPNPEGAVRPA